jgi:hypothetical protein
MIISGGSLEEAGTGLARSFRMELRAKPVPLRTTPDFTAISGARAPFRPFAGEAVREIDIVAVREAESFSAGRLLQPIAAPGSGRLEPAHLPR